MSQNILTLTRLFTALILFLLTTATLFAQEPQSSFPPPEDIVLIWAKRIGLIMTIAAALLILYTLIFRGRRLMEYQTKWLLFISLCALPLPVLFVSTGVGLGQSKDVAFCSHCHVMDSFINDMKDQNSETLAALHYRNRYIQREHCWVCHSDYGIFGTVKAKVDGLTDVYKYTTRTYQLPIKMRHPYDFSFCLYCHASSALFQQPRKEPGAHEGVLEAVVKKEATCTDCHELAHPPREKRSTEP